MILDLYNVILCTNRAIITVSKILTVAVATTGLVETIIDIFARFACVAIITHALNHFVHWRNCLARSSIRGTKILFKKLYTNRIRLLTSAVKESVALRVIEVVPTVTIAGTSFRVIFALCCVIAMKVLYTVVVTVFTEHKTITYTLWYTNFSIVVIQVMFPG